VAERSKKPVVIITGVSGGIGLATAKLFAQRGWLVVGTVRPGKQAGRYQDELAAAAVDVQRAEMTRVSDLERLVKKTVSTYGRIDALVASAGYGLWGGLESLAARQISHQLSVNLVAVAELVRLTAPVMRRAGGGVIVAISSLAGRFGLPEAPAYSSSKFALEGLMESMWHSLAASNIRVRLIEPGPVDSPFWRHRLWGNLARPPKRNWPVLEYSLTSGQVAEKIYAATTRKSRRLRYPVGVVRLVVTAKKVLPERLFFALVEAYYKRKRRRR
jgi:short-subunit dehydrogenase